MPRAKQNKRAPPAKLKIGSERDIEDGFKPFTSQHQRKTLHGEVPPC